jgi:hypothetical protein
VNQLAWMMVLAACGQGGSAGFKAAGSLEGGSLADVKVTPSGKDRVRLELTLLDKDGAPIASFVNPHVGPRIELALRDGQDELLCKASETIRHKDHDPKTGRVTFETQFFAAGAGDCIPELRKRGYQGKPRLFLNVAENGKVIRHEETLASFEVGTDRLAALDAEIAALGTAIAEIDPVLVLPKCTAEHLGATRRFEAVDQPVFMAKPPPGSDEAWTWLSTGLFDAIARYQRHQDDKPEETLAAMKATRKLFVYVATRHAVPVVRSPTEFEPGVFEGGLYLLDRDAGKATCSIPLVATSSGTINYTASTTRRGSEVTTRSDAHTKLLADFKVAVSSAVTRALEDAGLAALRPLRAEAP